MEKIPTAEEFMNLYHGSTNKHALIEFAKLHVEQALKEASWKAEIESCGNPYDPSDSSKCVNVNSILNSYPLENIK